MEHISPLSECAGTPHEKRKHFIITILIETWNFFHAIDEYY